MKSAHDVLHPYVFDMVTTLREYTRYDPKFDYDEARRVIDSYEFLIARCSEARMSADHLRLHKEARYCIEVIRRMHAPVEVQSER